MTIRLPDSLASQVEQEALARSISKSDVVRERLAEVTPARQGHPLADILAEIDSARVPKGTRNGAQDKKRLLARNIRSHYRAAKRHYR